MKVQGKVAVITGGVSGLGRGTANLLVKEGAKVVLFDMNEELGAKAQSEIYSKSSVDLALRDAFRTLVRDTRAELARIYASDAPREQKLAEKARALAAMSAAYERAKAGEPGLAGYDRWFAGDGGGAGGIGAFAQTRRSRRRHDDDSRSVRQARSARFRHVGDALRQRQLIRSFGRS